MRWRARARPAQEGDLALDFCTASRRCNWSVPEATYLQSHWPRVHPASGRRGTTFPMYSTPSCDCAASQASDPKRIRALRNRPSLCAFRNARSELAICMHRSSLAARPISLGARKWRYARVQA
jgi:hypothetical protein